VEIITNRRWQNLNPNHITMNERLDFLKRKNEGNKRMETYVDVFIHAGFNKSELVNLDLTNSDKLIKELNGTFSNLEKHTELLGNENYFFDSNLMREIYLSLNEDSKCYVYTDDYQFCGIFILNAKRGFENAFNVAKYDAQNTCFLLDIDLKYSFVINYYDKNHIDEPNSFDVQLYKL
jgi:hypothetical protein